MKSGRCGDDRDGEGDYDKDRGVARSIMDHVMGEHYWCFEEEGETMMEEEARQYYNSPAPFTLRRGLG